MHLGRRMDWARYVVSAGAASGSTLHLGRCAAWPRYVVSAGAASGGTLHLGRCMGWAQYVVSAGAASGSTLHLGRRVGWAQYVASAGAASGSTFEHSPPFEIGRLSRPESAPSGLDSHDVVNVVAVGLHMIECCLDMSAHGCCMTVI